MPDITMIPSPGGSGGGGIAVDTGSPAASVGRGGIEVAADGAESGIELEAG